MIRALTDTADQAVILPVTAAVFAILLLTGRHAPAFRWLTVVCGVLASVLAAKAAVAACGGLLPPAWDLRSPSGHTASATVVYGGLAILTLRVTRWRALLVALAPAAAVGASRLALEVHTVADVVAGLGIGLVGAMMLAAVSARDQLTPPRGTLVAVALLVCALNGLHLDAERRIAGAASQFCLCRTLHGDANARL